MKYEQYTSLITKLEKYAEENPKGYEFRVAALGALGYAYFGALLLTFLLIPFAVIVLIFFVPKLLLVVLKLAGKLVWLILIGFASFFGVIWSFLKSFWTKVPAPEGFELSREEVPQLYELVEQTSDFLKSPRPQHILLTEDFNAAVVTLPKYGVFGKRTYLILGLPLMQAISPEQFRAVLAHEIGHISEKHGSYAAWAYSLQESWGRFLQSQEAEGHQLSFLYEKFLNWYFPYFGAYSFVLRRRHEREADNYAVQFVGAKSLGEALINVEVKSLNLSQKFWKDVLDEAGREQTPPKEIFTRMATAFRESNKPQDLMHLTKAVAINTGYNDSHPSLSERLKAIGYWKNADLPDLPDEVTETASQKYFGKLEDKFFNVFNNLWQERVKEEWKKRHDHLLEAQKKIEDLDEKAKSETLSTDELYEKANLTAERYGDRQSLPIFYEIIARDPEHAHTNFIIGSILLNEDDEKGIEFIEKAMRINRTLKLAGCENIYYFLRGRGKDEEAKKYILTIEEEQESIGLAEKERAGVFPTDNFSEHDIKDETLQKICGKMQYYDEIQAAYLVKKSVRHYTEVPLYVMFLDTKKKGWIGNSNTLKTEDLLQVMVERFSEFGIHYFVVLENDFKAVKPRIENIPNAKIYQR
jgi:Zn-dependent protease with chaperone function